MINAAQKKRRSELRLMVLVRFFLSCRFWFLQRRSSPPLGFKRLVQVIRDCSRRNQNHPECERAHAHYLFALASYDGETEHQHRSDADCNRPEQPARHAERTWQLRFFNAQDNQRKELKRETRPIEKDIDRNE